MEQTLDNAENGSLETQEKVESSSAIDWEAEARKTKWVPKDDYPGDPARWVDAETWVKRGDLKHQVREARKEIAEIQRAAQEYRQFVDEAAARKEQEWKDKYAEVLRSKAQAITNGEGEKVIEAEAHQRELEAARPQPKSEQPKIHPDYQAWLDANPWYGTDLEKTAEANLIGIKKAKTGLRGKDLYEAIDAEFEAKARESTGTERAGPQRGGRVAAAAKGARSFDNLKPEFREQCERQFKFFAPKGQKEAEWRASWVTQATEDMFRS